MPKFDFIIGNPPYLMGLHTKIFNTVFKSLLPGGELCWVAPSTAIINRKQRKINSADAEFIKIIEDYNADITIIKGNNYFSVGLLVPLAISKITATKSPRIKIKYEHVTPFAEYEYDSLEKISIHGNEIAHDIKTKVLNKMSTSLHDKLIKKSTGLKIPAISGHVASSTTGLKIPSISTGHVAASDNGLKIPAISGNVAVSDTGYNFAGKDFFQLVYRRDQNDIDALWTTDGTNIIGVPFEHRENLFAYIKTKFARFCLSFYKINQVISGELKGVPYLDFSKAWAPTDLYAYFNLTKEETNFIEKFIPNLYESEIN